MLNRSKPSLIDREEFPYLFGEDHGKYSNSPSPGLGGLNANNQFPNLNFPYSSPSPNANNFISPSGQSPYKDVPHNPIPIVYTPRTIKNFTHQNKSSEEWNGSAGATNILLGKSENLGKILQKNGITPDKFNLDSAKKKFVEEKLKHPDSNFDFGSNETFFNSSTNFFPGQPKKKSKNKGKKSHNNSNDAKNSEMFDSYMYEPANDDGNPQTALDKWIEDDDDDTKEELERAYEKQRIEQNKLKMSGGVVPELSIRFVEKRVYSPGASKKNIDRDFNIENDTNNNSKGHSTKITFNNNKNIKFDLKATRQQEEFDEPIKTQRLKIIREEKEALRREIEEKRMEEMRGKRELVERVRGSRKTVSLADIIKFQKPLGQNSDVLKEAARMSPQKTQALLAQQQQIQQMQQMQALSAQQQQRIQQIKQMQVSFTNKNSQDDNNSGILNNIDHDPHEYDDSTDNAVNNINLNFMKNQILMQSGAINNMHGDPDEAELTKLSFIRQSGNSTSPRLRISPGRGTANLEIEEAIRYYQASVLKNKQEKAEINVMIELFNMQREEENREVAAQVKDMKNKGKTKILNFQFLKQDWIKKQKDNEQKRILEKKRQFSAFQQIQKRINEFQKQEEDDVLHTRKRKMEEITQFVSQTNSIEKQLLTSELNKVKQKQREQNRAKVEIVKKNNQVEKQKSETVLIENLNKQKMMMSITKQQIKQALEMKTQQELIEKRQQIISVKSDKIHRKKKRELQRRQIQLVEKLKQISKFQNQKENSAVLDDSTVAPFKPQDLQYTNGEEYQHQVISQPSSAPANHSRITHRSNHSGHPQPSKQLSSNDIVALGTTMSPTMNTPKPFTHRFSVPVSPLLPDMTGNLANLLPNLKERSPNYSQMSIENNEPEQDMMLLNEVPNIETREGSGSSMMAPSTTPGLPDGIASPSPPFISGTSSPNGVTKARNSGLNDSQMNNSQTTLGSGFKSFLQNPNKKMSANQITPGAFSHSTSPPAALANAKNLNLSVFHLDPNYKEEEMLVGTSTTKALNTYSTTQGNEIDVVFPFNRVLLELDEKAIDQNVPNNNKPSSGVFQKLNLSTKNYNNYSNFKQKSPTGNSMPSTFGIRGARTAPIGKDLPSKRGNNVEKEIKKIQNHSNENSSSEEENYNEEEKNEYYDDVNDRKNQEFSESNFGKKKAKNENFEIVGNMKISEDSREANVHIDHESWSPRRMSPKKIKWPTKSNSSYENSNKNGNQLDLGVKIHPLPLVAQPKM